MENLSAIFIFILVILAAIIVITAFLDVIGNKRLSGNDKIIWIIFIVVAPIIGSLVYFILGKKVKN